MRTSYWPGIILFLATAAGGFFLLRAANGMQSEAAMVAGWTRTDGRLLELKIVYAPALKSHTYYDAIPLYSFEANGRDFTGRAGTLLLAYTSMGDRAHVENWGPTGVQIMAAISALERFHEQWRAAAATAIAV